MFVTHNKVCPLLVAGIRFCVFLPLPSIRPSLFYWAWNNSAIAFVKIMWCHPNLSFANGGKKILVLGHFFLVGQCRSVLCRTKLWYTQPPVYEAFAKNNISTVLFTSKWVKQTNARKMRENRNCWCREHAQEKQGIDGVNNYFDCLNGTMVYSDFPLLIPKKKPIVKSADIFPSSNKKEPHHNYIISRLICIETKNTF